ncbi:DbpA RNA binding domain-containing protein, partial [Francisella tularensis subsp. holarctica]|uniref:DbpA RNA binding domain-containing protein n=1 Tax=Francisella tularensis TaxID=263 RepID=UPI002381CB44
QGDRSKSFDKADSKPRSAVNIDISTYKLDVGRDNDVQARNIVGAISNEGNIDSKHICNISIQKDYTLVDITANLSPKVIN